MSHDNEKFSSSALDQGNLLDEGVIRDIVELYERVVQQRTAGPQLEGLEASQLEKALREDPGNVLLLDILDSDGEVKGKWPLFIPIGYHQDYSQRFFEDHYPERPVYYISPPPYEDIELLISVEGCLANAAQFLEEKNAILAYDYLEGNVDEHGKRTEHGERLTPLLVEKILEDSDLHAEDITPVSKMHGWDIDYGLPLSVHYEGVTRLIRPVDVPAATIEEAAQRLIDAGIVEHLPQDGLTFLSREDLEAHDNEILDSLWDVYAEQFDELIEDHPILGEQPEGEFKAMLLDETTINISLMIDGEACGLLYIVTDPSKCPWLNSEKFEGKIHIPGIVVRKDKAQQGAGYAHQMMDLALKVLAEMNQDITITFACSNVSSKYIPKMTMKVVQASEEYEFRDGKDGLQKTATYGYRILEVS